MKAVTHTPAPLPQATQEAITERVTELLACAGIHEGSHLSPKMKAGITELLGALHAGRVVLFRPTTPGHFEALYWEGTL